MAISAEAKPTVNRVSGELNVFAGSTALMAVYMVPAQPFLVVFSCLCWAASGILQRIGADPARNDYNVITMSPGVTVPPLPEMSTSQLRVLADFIALDASAAAVAITLDRLEGIVNDGQTHYADRERLARYDSVQRRALAVNWASTDRYLSTLVGGDSTAHLGEAFHEKGRSAKVGSWQDAVIAIGETNPVLTEWMLNSIGPAKDRLSGWKAREPGTASAAAPEPPPPGYSTPSAKQHVEFKAGEFSESLLRLSKVFGDPHLAFG